jgi:hypothetical protein
MKVYIPLYGHTNTTTLPLRFGVVLKQIHQCFCELSDAVFDEEGTNQQRADEIHKGRKRYSGNLSIPSTDQSELLGPFNCNVVLEPPSRSDQAPRVITILGSDKESIKGDLTVSRHIEGMLKSGQITTDDLVNVFHPAYAHGLINSSNDCETIWREQVKEKVAKPEVSDRTNSQILASLTSQNSNFNEVMKVDDIEEVDLKSPLTYESMTIPGVQYDYVMADAYIENVRKDGNQIAFDYISSKGEVKIMRSFPLAAHLVHLAPLHEYAFDYLSSRQEQRAKFAICVSKKYLGTFAESVTSIALQVKRAGLATSKHD